MSHLILDAIFAVIIIVGIILGVKRGAVKVILSLVALIFSAYLAYYLATPAAVFINNKFIAPSLSKDIYETIESGEDPKSVLPNYITDSADDSEINFEGLKIHAATSEKDVADFVNSHISPLTVNIISALLILILFIIISIILNLFINLFNKLVKHSFVGGINSFLGGVFGALNGFVIVTVICIIISVTVKYSVNTPFNITEDTVNSSLFYRLFLYIL